MANTDKGLQIWMPMAKDLHNQGLAKISITNSGAIYSSTGGKLGGCYVFSGTSLQYLTSNTNILSQASEFTIACWVNINSSSYYIFILKQSSYYQFSLDNNAIGYRDNATSAYTKQDINIPIGSWHHFAVTLKDKKVTIYIDGQETNNFIIAGTKLNNINQLFIGGDNASSGRYGNCSINDFRIYSYALSPQEIKELARGKVAHYPCDSNDIFTSPNLVTGLVAGGRTTISGNTVNISGENADTFFRLKLRRAMVSGRMYRLTCWGSGFPQDACYTFPIAGQTNTGPGTIKVENGGCSLIFTANDTCANVGTSVILDDVYRSAGAGQISNIVLQEIGPEAFLSDISGFGRHGQVTGGVTLSDDTKRYDKSLKFDGTGHIILKDKAACKPSDRITISCWIKPFIVSGTTMPIGCTESGGHGFQIQNGQIKTSVCIGGSYYNQYYNIAANTWYHVAITYDGTSIKLYVNGDTKAETAVTGSFSYNTDNGWAFGGNITSNGTDTTEKYNGLISDIRLYATALSADDIKELYSLGH